MKILFWNVDTQQDFCHPDGKLYVQGAESIKPNLGLLTKITKDNDIQVVSTADCHLRGDSELSNSPDFKTTFPDHCMAGEIGADFIKETNPYFDDCAMTINYNDKELNVNQLYDCKNIIIEKNKFDVFTGNPFTNQILDVLSPEVVVVYGVATSFCVANAIDGLTERGVKVVVVDDAIHDLPNFDTQKTINQWIGWGVQIASTKMVEFLINITKEEGYDN